MRHVTRRGAYAFLFQLLGFSAIASVNGVEPWWMVQSRTPDGSRDAERDVCAVASAGGSVGDLCMVTLARAHPCAGDEGKPRCRNCVDRNFKCQYGPQLTFLSKNAQTVQPSEVESVSAAYEAIRVGAARAAPQDPADRVTVCQ